MAEDIVEDVGLLQVVELLGPADELAGGKAPVGQMVEEDVVRHQPRHGHHAPAGQPLQLRIDPLEVGDAAAMQIERVEPAQERVAGPARQSFALALVQGRPDAVLVGGVAVPALIDGPVGPRAGAGSGRSCPLRT